MNKPLGITSVSYKFNPGDIFVFDNTKYVIFNIIENNEYNNNDGYYVCHQLYFNSSGNVVQSTIPTKFWFNLESKMIDLKEYTKQQLALLEEKKNELLESERKFSCTKLIYCK